ncbi:hypothetical protein [Prosthecobacter fluviatilis]|uniref:Outer membrane protein n=1 Tax=Prosthecobacter fluviatilis TaxID=445931 RepID=A0ABW0KUC5_9BACT
MKPKSMTSFIAKSVTVLAACAALNASAGTAPAKNPVPVEEKTGALFESIGATFDAGYDSRYYFRGLWFADNIMWTALNISVPITEKLTWGIGGAYINTAGTPFPNNGSTAPAGTYSKQGFQYSEVDAITNLTYDAGWAKFGMQYQYYFYPDNYGGAFNGTPNALNDPEFALKGAGELGWTVAVPIKGFNIYAGYYYDFRISGQYISLGADYTFAVTDWLSIVPSVNTGFGIDYYTGNGSGSIPGGGVVGNKGQSLQQTATSGFTHVLYTLAVPVKLTKSVTWTSYVAMNHGEKLRTQLNTTQNEIYWGTKLSFAF